MPVRWKTTQLLPGSSAPPARPVKLPAAAAKQVPSMVVTEEMGEHIFEMFSRSNPRRWDGNARPREGQPQLSESVELTPGGRKKHKLQRTSPGGTT